MRFSAVQFDFVYSVHFRRQISLTRAVAPTKLSEAENSRKRRRSLKRVDRALSNGDYKTAVSLVKQSQGKPGGLRGFGAAKQVPKRLSSLDEAELNGIDLTTLRPLVDSILDSIARCIKFSLLDEVSVKKLESLINDEGHESRCEEDHFMCAQHEAGHFLVGYLLGVLPKEYKVPSIQTLSQNKFATGSVSFVGFDFLGEVGTMKNLNKNVNRKSNSVNKGKISSKTFNQFCCVILGGLVAEHLVVGYSDGLHADVDKLESVLHWLGLTENEKDLHKKWAALNTAFILCRHYEARSRLAEAMVLGRSVGFCIDTIENCFLGKEL